MMPEWHQLVSMSGHVEESEAARKLQLYETSIYQVHSFVCQLDYWPVLVLACELVSTLIWFSVLYQVKSCLKERMILALKRGKY